MGRKHSNLEHTACSTGSRPPGTVLARCGLRSNSANTGVQKAPVSSHVFAGSVAPSPAFALTSKLFLLHRPGLKNHLPMSTSLANLKFQSLDQHLHLFSSVSFSLALLTPYLFINTVYCSGEWISWRQGFLSPFFTAVFPVPKITIST